MEDEQIKVAKACETANTWVRLIVGKGVGEGDNY